MALEIKTPPGEEPLSLAETKSYLKVTGTADDTLLTQIITAVRKSCEDWTGRALITQTWTLWRGGFPHRRRDHLPHDGYFELPVDFADAAVRVLDIPKPPLQSVTFLKTYNAAHAASTFDAAKYFVDTASEPGRIVLNESSSWPTGLRPANGVEIEFVAGYGDAASVPDALKQGLLLWIKGLYANRNWLFELGESIPGLAEFNQHDVPPPVASLWAPYKIYALGGRR
ncbi:MAG: hypothetical protein GWN87_27705 [Desulfuromonadales bacterium]|nr:hypothetical protein [Desulfuromonadales bacterium]